MGFEEELREKFAWLSKNHFGNRKKMCDETGIDYNSLTSFLNGKGMNVAVAARAIDYLGARLAWPMDEVKSETDTTREVCFVNPRIVAAMEDAPPPVPDDYLAVPLTAEPVAAGHGRVPSEEIKSWVVVWKHHESVRFKSNLVAVEIGKGERSMLPLFAPGDILLVNREDTSPDPAGKIMLVRDPDGGCAIKRVSMVKDDGDYTLTFYSENAREFPPMLYKLKRDYGGNIELALAGHVVWAWSDVRGK